MTFQEDPHPRAAWTVVSFKVKSAEFRGAGRLWMRFLAVSWAAFREVSQPPERPKTPTFHRQLLTVYR